MGTTGAARGPEKDVDDVLAVARSWAEAIVSNDVARIAAFVADEWVVVDASGIAPGRRFLELVASDELTHSAMAPAGPLRVRVHGDTAVVTGRVTNTAHHQGQQFDADEWTTDVFVRGPAGWSCVLTHLTDAAS